jgi:hypothetical protein
MTVPHCDAQIRALSVFRGASALLVFAERHGPSLVTISIQNDHCRYPGRKVLMRSFRSFVNLKTAYLLWLQW